MKRKLLLSSAVVPALFAFGAAGQVVNFCDVNNGSPVTPAPNFNIGNYYNELFAGQGAYSDPGNNIWNGFVNAGFTYGSTYVYSGPQGSSGPIPVPLGNPGNPYAAYNTSTGWVISDGPALFDFSGPASACGNSTSDGQWTQITLSPMGYTGDTTTDPNFIQNGSPAFLFSTSAECLATNDVFVLQNVPTNATYGLFLYGANPHNNRGTTFSVNSGTPHNGIASTLNAGSAPAQTFVEGQNYVIFENVSADTSSNITITASPNPIDGVGNGNLASNSDINGFQLIFNPKPTAVAWTVAQNVLAGGTAKFSFTPVFAPSASFRWQSIIGGVTNALSDGGDISGSGTTNLTISNVGAPNVGLYRCVITTATATNTTPAAPLTILTSTTTVPLQAGDPITAVGLLLQPGDTLSDFNNLILQPNERYNSPPPQFNMTTANIEDNNLYQYVNLGSNGTTAPFGGPVGFIVTPKSGITVAKGMRIFTASRYPEDDPADYLLEGSSDGGITFKAIAGGLLALPAARNAAAGVIDITNQALQEIDFANTNGYGTYRVTFTNINESDTASNGLQFAELELIGSYPPVPPGIVLEPVASNAFFVGETFLAGVTPSGPGPLTYQWYFNTATPVPNGTSAILTLPNVQPSNAGNYTCTISNPYGQTNSTIALLSIITNPPPVVGFNGDGADWILNKAVNPGSIWPGGANTPGITNDVLILDDGTNGETDSAFFDAPQFVGSFIVSFTFQFALGTTSTPADGMTFCIQNNTVTNTWAPLGGVYTIGGGGGGIGFAGLNYCAALELNVYAHDNGIGYQFGTNGNVPANDTAMGPYISPGPIVLTNGDPIFIQLYYNQNVATLSMVDSIAGVSFLTNFSVPDLTGGYYNQTPLVGGRSAWVGFTGGNGALNAILTASNFVYSYTTPPILSIAPGGTAGSVNVTWPISVSTLFQLQQSPALTGPWTKVTAPVIVNSQIRNQATLTPGTKTAFYRLSLQ
jgi:hypothetical protein